MVIEDVMRDVRAKRTMHMETRLRDGRKSDLIVRGRED